MIHGANGTGAAFAPLAGELRARGHEVVAPDLPIEDRDATFADYAATVPGGDVIVGHSMGGVTASLVARRDGARVVYVAALLPQAGVALKAQFVEMMCPGVARALARRDGLDFWTDAASFGLDPTSMRGQSLAPYFDALEAAVPGRYVVCARDRVVAPAYQRSVPMESFELDCGHDAFRERPADVADLLGA
ncbi:MAG: alpha/beta hydrolase family protein [Solirubrobacteraceae bacterium]